jgi:hypothetical protein
MQKLRKIAMRLTHSCEFGACNCTTPRMVAVETRIAPRPPHRSRRALLTHRAYMRTRLSRGYSGGV